MSDEPYTAERILPFDRYELTVTAVCSECDRTEEFADQGMACAWLAGHYDAEHPDELPDFRGTGDTDE